MKMSTRGRFGLRALLYVAVVCNDHPVSVSEVARSMNVSPDYLMQLFVKMRRSGLLESVRGPNGGFKFARSKDGITVGDIIRSVEGSLSPIDCVPEDASGCVREFDDSDVCPKAPACLSRVAWLEITEGIVDIFDSVTLSDVLRKAN
jgi:Rrf2 family cysteine metabolism transcriptional repressor